MKPAVMLFAVAASMLALAGCGGGGSSQTTAATDTATTAATTDHVDRDDDHPRGAEADDD